MIESNTIIEEFWHCGVPKSDEVLTTKEEEIISVLVCVATLLHLIN